MLQVQYHSIKFTFPNIFDFYLDTLSTHMDCEVKDECILTEVY